VARAGRGKRWQYQLGVGRVRVPGKRRVKGPGYGAIRRRMSRGTHTGGGFSSSKALLALMTGGISLFFTGSPFSGADDSPIRSRVRRSKRDDRYFDPRLQISLESRRSAQELRALQRLDEIKFELLSLREEVWAAEISGESPTVRRGTKRIAQLDFLHCKWREQLLMLEQESNRQARD
jgi:hypothetical protein